VRVDIRTLNGRKVVIPLQSLETEEEGE